MAAFEWLNDNSRNFLASGYLLEGEGAEERTWDLAQSAEDILGIEGFADKFYYYMGEGFYSLSSPTWSNFGRKQRGISPSCFGSEVNDSVADILYTQSEVGVMSKLGGGTSINLTPVRARGSLIKDNGKTSGSVHFARLFEQVTDVVSQGSARRGRVAAYLDMEHDDIMEFLDIATDGNIIQGITTGVTVSDEFMKKVEDNVGDARKKWAKVLKTRASIGWPYIFFTGTASRNKPDIYKDKGMEIKASNLCS